MRLVTGGLLLDIMMGSCKAVRVCSSHDIFKYYYSRILRLFWQVCQFLRQHSLQPFERIDTVSLHRILHLLMVISKYLNDLLKPVMRFPGLFLIWVSRRIQRTYSDQVHYSRIVCGHLFQLLGQGRSCSLNNPILSDYSRTMSSFQLFPSPMVKRTKLDGHRGDDVG